MPHIRVLTRFEDANACIIVFKHLNLIVARAVEQKLPHVKCWHTNGAQCMIGSNYLCLSTALRNRSLLLALLSKGEMRIGSDNRKIHSRGTHRVLDVTGKISVSKQMKTQGLFRVANP